MNPFALSGLLTGITSLSFGYFVYLKGRTQPLNRLWFVFTASVAVWGLGGLWIGLARTETEALWAWRLAFACGDRKSTRLNSSHLVISYAVFCLKKKKKMKNRYESQ